MLNDENRLFGLTWWFVWWSIGILVYQQGIEMEKYFFLVYS